MTREVGGSTPPSRAWESSAGGSRLRPALPDHPNQKLFVVVRGDLPPGLRVAQAIHAALLFAHEHEEVALDWFLRSNNVVVLRVEDLPALEALASRAESLGVPGSLFREPDLGDQATALALAPSARRLVSKLPLAV